MKEDKRMSYNFTSYYKTEEERIKAISEDILIEYPGLGLLAQVAAKMETPFGRVHEDYDQFSHQENCINRLIDIVIITEGKPEYQEEYRKAREDLINYYNSWKVAFTYANPEEQAVHLLMETFKKHETAKNIPLITFSQARKEQQRRSYEKDLKRRADILRAKYPKIGPIADEVVRLEEESGIWLRFQENDIVRLVYIIKLTECKPEYAEVYQESISELRQMYSDWFKYETRYLTPEKEIVMEMIDRLNKHFADPSLPVTTYAEIKQERDQAKELAASGPRL